MKISKALYQAITDRKIRFSYLTKLGVFNGLSDEQYLKLKYKNVFGRDLDLEIQRRSTKNSNGSSCTTASLNIP